MQFSKRLVNKNSRLDSDSKSLDSLSSDREDEGSDHETTKEQEGISLLDSLSKLVEFSVDWLLVHRVYGGNCSLYGQSIDHAVVHLLVLFKSKVEQDKT